MLTIQAIIAELRYRLARANDDLAESRSFGTATLGFNQDLGARDALREFLTWIEEQKDSKFK